MAADNVFKEQTSFDYLTPTAQKISQRHYHQVQEHLITEPGR